MVSFRRVLLAVVLAGAIAAVVPLFTGPLTAGDTPSCPTCPPPDGPPGPPVR